MRNRIFTVALMISFIGFISCQKDKDDSNVSVKESKTILENLPNQMKEDINAVYDESGWVAANAFVSLMAIDDPVFGNTVQKKSTRDKLTLDKVLKMSMLKGSDPLVFTDYVGTYTWNPVNQGWMIVQNDPSDKVIFKFPLDGPQGTNNNVTLTLSDYQEVEITETNEYFTDVYYEPTLISADLSVDGTKYLELNFSASWDLSTGEPTNFDASLFVKPYTLSLTMGQESNAFQVEFIMKEGDSRICSVGMDVTASGSDILTPETFSGYVQYRQVKLEGDVNLAALEGLETQPTVDFLNSNVDLAFYNYPEDSKFADVEFKEDTETGGMGINILFTDGTTMDGMEFINNLMAAMDEYMGEIVPAK